MATSTFCLLISFFASSTEICPFSSLSFASRSFAFPAAIFFFPLFNCFLLAASFFSCAVIVCIPSWAFESPLSTSVILPGRSSCVIPCSVSFCCITVSCVLTASSWLFNSAVSPTAAIWVSKACFCSVKAERLACSWVREVFVAVSILIVA